MRKFDNISYRRSRPFMVGDTVKEVALTMDYPDIMLNLSKYDGGQFKTLDVICEDVTDGSKLTLVFDTCGENQIEDNVLVAVKLTGIVNKEDGVPVPMDIDIYRNNKWHNLNINEATEWLRLHEVKLSVGDKSKACFGMGVMDVDGTDYVVQVARCNDDGKGTFVIVRGDLMMQFSAFDVSSIIDALKIVREDE